MMTSSSSSARRCIIVLFLGYYRLCHSNCFAAFHASTPPRFSPKSKSSRPTTPDRLSPTNSLLPSSCIVRRASRLPGNRNTPNTILRISTVDVDVPKNDIRDNFGVNNADALLSWRDVLPLSLYAAMCLFGAVLVSTYEDYDVTHTRPSPSTIRLPTTISSAAASSSAPFDDPTFSWSKRFDFIGAATHGLGWGPSDRGLQGIDHKGGGSYDGFFEEWYGVGATTLQFKPSYNEVMLQHRTERVPRWTELANRDGYAPSPISAIRNGMRTPSTISKAQLQQAVLQLYRSVDELNELKIMADDYRWDEMKEHLNPTATSSANANGATQSKDRYPLLTTLEYSMDTLKYMPSSYAPSAASDSPDSNVGELIGFDWGSCALRHCGAKADAQEAIAELYNDVGMLEPFECRFIIDVVERSIQDVLAIIPDDLKPHKNGVILQPRPYEAYVPKSGNYDEMGIDFEYAQALSEVRIDLTSE